MASAGYSLTVAYVNMAKLRTALKLPQIGKLILMVTLCLFIFDAYAAGTSAPSANPMRDCNLLSKPTPECLPPAGRNPAPDLKASQPANGVPVPLGDDLLQKAQRALQSAPGQNGPSGRINADRAAADLQWFKDNAQITLNSNGGVFRTTSDGAKFFVFLDDAINPVSTLKCQPSGIVDLAQVQDTGRGRNLYPVVMMGIAPGTCVLSSGNFSMTVVVTDPVDQ